MADILGMNEIRTVYLDSDLNIKAYLFKGIMQNFHEKHG